MKLYEMLDQNKVWIDGQGVTHELKTMDPMHRDNVLAWLERRVDSLKAGYEFRLLMGPQPGGDAASDCFDAAMDELMDMSDEEWFEELPLVRKLRKLKRRQTETLSAARRSRPLRRVERDVQGPEPLDLPGARFVCFVEPVNDAQQDRREWWDNGR